MGTHRALRRLIGAGLALALAGGVGTASATTFRIDAKDGHSTVVHIPPEKLVGYEISYTGLGYYHQDYTDTAPASGESSDCPPSGSVTTEKHVYMRIAFDAVWRVTVRVDGGRQGKAVKGSLKTNGSRYTLRGFDYDEACPKHTYPASGGPGATCKGRLLPAAGPPILTGYNRRGAPALNLSLTPFEGFRLKPADCPRSPSDFEPAPPAAVIDSFPNIGAAGTVSREFLRRDEDGTMRYHFDAHLPRDCSGGSPTTKCVQTFKGDGAVILHFLGRRG
jgi:hypothetical protein